MEKNKWTFWPSQYYRKNSFSKVESFQNGSVYSYRKITPHIPSEY